MNRVIKDNKVAVLISPGFGAGWYTWHNVEALLYDPVVVNMLETGKSEHDIEQYCNDTYGTSNYYGDINSLTVTWVPVGTRFYIHEYDGDESLVTEEEMASSWLRA